MPGIRLANQRQVLIEMSIMDTSADPTARGATTCGVLQPTGDKAGIGACIAPFNGKVVAWVGVIAAAGVANTGTALKEEWWLENKGVAFGGSTQASDKAVTVDLSLTPDYIPALGETLVVPGVSGANGRVRTGDVLSFVFDTIGTIGDSTRPKFTPIGIILEADVTVDPRHPSNKR